MDPDAVQKWIATPVNWLAVSPGAVSVKVTVLALTTPLGCPLTFAKSKANVPNWLIFCEVLKFLKLKPVFPSALKLLTLPAVNPEAPLNAMSPPFNFTEKPAFIVMVTVTVLAPASTMLTVPIVPEIPKLFAVRSKEVADAAGIIATAATRTKARTESLRLVMRTAFPLWERICTTVTRY